jgi:cyanophycinase
MKISIFSIAALLGASAIAACLATGDPQSSLGPSLGGEAALACRSSESESNDGQSKANSDVCSAQVVQGTISKKSDVDWYSFSVAASGSISVSLTHNSGSDFDWYLYRSTGASVARGTTKSVPEVGSYDATAAGTYYLEVVPHSGTGAYSFTVGFPSAGGGTDCGYGTRPAQPSGLQAFIVGSGADKCVTPTEAGLLLMGGGIDVDAAFSNRIRPRLAGGDIVVLRTTGTDAYNAYFNGLMAPDSVETIVVDSVAKANSAYVDWAIRSAEFVWLAGGDQSSYLNNWQGTKVQLALRHVHDKGSLLGGTSAGLAVLGDVIYDPDNVTAAVSADAVANPCSASMMFSENFLDLPRLQGVITDTHFQNRDRMGRLLAFMARIGGTTIAPNRRPITGIGVDQATSMFINAAGSGVVDGVAAVYVLREDAGTTRTEVTCGRPVVYGGVQRYSLSAGATFDFVTGQSSVTPVRIGVDGRLPAFYLPANPY